MQALEFNVSVPAPFRARVRTNLRTPLIMTGVFAIIAIGFTSLMHTVFLRFFVVFLDAVLFVLAIVLQIKWAQKEERYFLTRLSMKPDGVEIEYTDMDVSHKVSGAHSEFVFKKKEILGRTGSSRQQSDLEIYYKGKPLLRQYVTEDWTDRRFIEIVHAATH